MINPALLDACLLGLVGFRNDLDQSLPKIGLGLTDSESSLIINDEHPLLTIQNILSSIDEGGTITLPSIYSESKNYKKDEEVISDSNEIHISLVGDNIGKPLTDLESWKNLGNPLTYYLKRKYKQGISELSNKLFTYKNLNDNAKTVLGDLTIFQGNGNIRNTILKRDRFVGFKIWLKEEGLSIILSKIGLQFTHPNPEFKIYLYHSSQLEPIKIFELDHTKEFSFQWISISNYILSYASADINDGGHFSIGYYESELVGEAIERKVPIHKWSGCGSCDPVSSNLFRKRTPYMVIQPFYVNSNDLQEDKTLWNEDREIILDDQNWGLNLQMSVMCDVTEIFCRNKYAIAKTLATQIAVLILSDMAYGTRDNQKFAHVSQLAMYALEDRDNKSPGMKSELIKAIKALSFNFSGINKRCLPCDLDNKSIEFGNIYTQ